MNKNIGLHIRNINSKDLIEKLLDIKKMSYFNCIQFMLTSKSKKALEEYKIINDFLIKNKIFIFIHASYYFNLTKSNKEHKWLNEALIKEIMISYKILNAIGIVVHLGSWMNLKFEEGVNNIIDNLVYINNKTLKYKIKIILETPSGTGKEKCYKLLRFSYLYNKLINDNRIKNKERFKICIDTCHLFTAGYNLNNFNNINRYITKFDKLINLDNVILIHFNNSMNKLNSRKDRHDNLDKGKIKLKFLLYFLNIIGKNKFYILETPKEGILNDLKILNKEYNK